MVYKVATLDFCKGQGLTHAFGQKIGKFNTLHFFFVKIGLEMMFGAILDTN